MRQTHGVSQVLYHSAHKHELYQQWNTGNILQSNGTRAVCFQVDVSKAQLERYVYISISTLQYRCYAFFDCVP